MLVMSGLFYISFHYPIDFLKPVKDSFRPSFIESLFLRRAFQLNQPGDARGDYYSNKQFTKLKVEVYRSSYGTLYQSSVDLIKKGADGVINKPEGIFIEDKELDDVPRKVADNFIDKLSDDIPRYSKNTAIIRVYILSTYEPHPTLTGQATGAYGFVIFKNSILESSKSQSVREDVEIETILHEIGHLLGAKHLDSGNCVMNKAVDVPNIVIINLIPTEYCFKDIQAIKEANR